MLLQQEGQEHVIRKNGCSALGTRYASWKELLVFSDTHEKKKQRRVAIYRKVLAFNPIPYYVIIYGLGFST